MTVLRMDKGGIVVADVAAAVVFLAELGLELEGQTTVERPPRRAAAIVGTREYQWRLRLLVYSTPTRS
jgi:hypothetical protein